MLPSCAVPATLPVRAHSLPDRFSPDSMNLIFAFFVARLLASGAGGEDNAWDQDFAMMRSDDGIPEPEFYDSSAGPEKLSMEMVRLKKQGEVVEEKGEMQKAIESEVDEETIRKAEKMADKDLLNGLNRILKNNETLEDIFKAENVYPPIS